MGNTPKASVENNFTGGLKTEFTGLNFPENACTEADNCVFSIIGDVNRRMGFDFEPHGIAHSLGTITDAAIATYKWDNVGGDGSTQIVVQQVGATLYFYKSSSATVASPLSTQFLASTVNISSFLATNAILAFDPSIECTFSDGNGYLFVFNAQCDPFYVSYNAAGDILTASRINIKIRDFVGVSEPSLQGTNIAVRPLVLTQEHQYNLVNQGWSYNNQGTSATAVDLGAINTGSIITFTYLTPPNFAFVVGSSIGIWRSTSTAPQLIGLVTASSLVSVTVKLTFASGTGVHSDWIIVPNPNLTSYWFLIMGNYPSNADQWWTYRNTSVVNPTQSSPPGLLGQFDPHLAANSFVIASNTQAPQGSMILNAFIQDRAMAASVSGITTISTVERPTNGAFYAGRVWYTGVDSNFQPTGDASFTTWTETIYFSQIVTTPDDFGQCYQQNDPTSPTLFNLLPSDGGTIVIQGSGPIYKLFRVQNGLLVFAANGIWYITGGAAIGFTADNYSVNKISGVRSIGYHSYVNVQGWPIFWNEEGIWQVEPGQENVPYGHGGYNVKNLALGTILSFYNQIPLQSKKYARGDYDPVSYTIQWIYRSTNENGVTSRYVFDSALNINTYKGPFYPYTINTFPAYICSILYVTSPGGTNAPESQFEYLTVSGGNFIFSQENDNVSWKDWVASGTPADYTSTFTTGYKLHGKAYLQWQIGYIYMFSDSTVPTAYRIRGMWDYGSSGNSGRWSTSQTYTNTESNFGNIFRRIRIRGRGLVLQLNITSVSGQPFNIAGWSTYEFMTQGI